MRRGPRLAVLAAAAALVACSDAGPGALTATLDGPQPVGALVVEVRGAGVTGVEGAGDARVFADPSPATKDVRRVVVVSASGAPSFRIQVQDVSAEAPTVTLVSAVDAANQPLASLAGYQVRVAR